MKTYKKTIEAKMLEIWNDDTMPNPRNDSANLGYFINLDKRHKSPDQVPWLQRIVEDTAYQSENQEQHIKILTESIESNTDEKVMAIYPIYKYEHSSITYHRGTTKGYDYSNGFYIVTNKTQLETGTRFKDFEKVIDQELLVYNAWVNGDIYGFTEYDSKGELLDHVGGFYSLDDIKKELGKKWEKENMEDYLIYN